MRLSKKSLKSEKRRVSGVEKLDIMRFILGRFALFSSEIEVLSNIIFFTQSNLFINFSISF